MGQSASADSSSKFEYSKWQSGSSHYEELLCQWACSQTADLSAGTVIAAATLQDCRRSVTAVKVRAMGGRAKTSRDQERSRAVRREPRWPSGGRAGASSAPQPAIVNSCILAWRFCAESPTLCTRVPLRNTSGICSVVGRWGQWGGGELSIAWSLRDGCVVDALRASCHFVLL